MGSKRFICFLLFCCKIGEITVCLYGDGNEIGGEGEVARGMVEQARGDAI